MKIENLELEEKILDQKNAFKGQIFDIDCVSVELPDGRSAKRDVLRHPGAVGIVAINDKGQILLVEQYRCALERITLEIPAGKIDPGEDPVDTAKRELREETGYEAANMKILTPFATAAGYSDEILHLYMATDLKFVGADLDDNEFIRVQWMDLGELVDLVLDAKVEDSKTIIGALICDAISHRIQVDKD